MRLDRFLNELLFENDCIIIPGLGGIVANPRPAFLNPASHTFNPPAKRLAFNTSLIVNDGLLASYISRRENISYAEALVAIENWVYQALLELKSGKELVLSGVGRLSLDAEKNLQFQPDHSVNHLVSAFGLSPVHSPAIRRDTHQNPTQAKIVKARSRFKAWRMIELIPAAAVLALLVFNPSVIQRLNHNIAQVNPFSVPSTSSIGVNLPVDSARPFSADQAQAEAFTETEMPKDTLASVPLEVIESEPASLSEVQPEKERLRSSPVKDFHVIGGCFKIEQNALNFRDEAIEKGWQAQIIGQNPAGLFMVSLAQADSRSGVEELAGEVRSGFEPSAWVYHR